MTASSKVALVTGAGAGVGLAAARRLASDGRADCLVVNDIDRARAEQAAAAITADTGVEAIAAVADVSDWAAVEAMFDELGTGGADIVINNAGIPVGVMGGQRFLDSGPADWAPWLDLNLSGVMNVTRLALPRMVDQGWGRVITIVSDAARVGEANLVAYSAAKAGAAGFMRALAREVGRHQITSNAVALGTILHGMLEQVLTPEQQEQMASRYVLRRLGRPEDPAGMISFLAGPDADWITGQTYPVNGGFAFNQ